MNLFLCAGKQFIKAALFTNGAPTAESQAVA